MNNKEKGNKLEKLIAGLLKDIDKYSRPTKGSGAGSEVSDILNKYFYVECKFRDTQDITIKSKVWQKLCADIPIGSLKTPIYVLQNKNKETFCVLDIKDFLRYAIKYHREE